MVTINRIGLLFVLVALLTGCKTNSTKWAIEGDYTVTRTSIFIKNFREGEESLYGTCGLKKISIQAHKVQIDKTCEFLSDVNDITIVDSFETTVDKFLILDRESFAHFVDGDSRRNILVFKARDTFNDGVNDSMYIVKKTVDTVILVHDPIVLEIVRTQSNKKNSIKCSKNQPWCFFLYW